MLKRSQGSRREGAAPTGVGGSLAGSVESIVDAVLAETARKSSDPDGLAGRLGVGSFDHMNFRYFLAPKLAELMDGRREVGAVKKAWVHSLDATESDPSAVDTAGDSSPCDGDMGSNLHLMIQVDSKRDSQKSFAGQLSRLLVKTLADRGVKVVEDYLQVAFITQEDIDEKRGETFRLDQRYYTATQVHPPP